jgi:hypothetical protein
VTGGGAPARGGTASGTPAWAVVVFFAALLLVFVGERVVPTVSVVRWTATGLGVLGVLGVTVLRWVAVRVTGGERRSVERALAILATTGALAVLVYLTTIAPFDAQLGVARLSAAARHRYDSAATVLWIAAILACALPTAFAERALYPMRRAERVEWRRVRDAIAGGLTLALAATYGVLYTFAAGELHVKADFSYLHTARPSEATKKLIEATKENVHVVGFFPDVNDVRAEVVAYLADLAVGHPNVDVEVRDRLLFPQLARDMKANDDGVLVIGHGLERQTLTIGTDLNAARPKLKTLDADFQKALSATMRERRTAYFTVGHGELNDAQPSSDNEGRTGRGIRHVVEQQNYSVKDLGATSGLGIDVPDDAGLVVILGPAQAPLPEEVAALGRYLDRGGRLFLCLDPDAKADLEPLGSLVGLTVTRTLLANDKVHLRRRYNDSDHSILATNRYSSHASVSTLGRIASHPVIFVGAGALDKKAGADGKLAIDFTVRALPDTFDDLNGNYLFEAATEKRQTFPLAAAVTRPTPGKKNPEMRAFVLGDADVVSDAVLANETNLILATDALHWLGGEESLAGAIQTTEDVRIEHTKQKDLLWFYGTIFGAPLTILAAGLFYTQRLRRAKRKPAAEPAREKAAS